MTPPKCTTCCPLCLKVFVALPHHLKRSHLIKNLNERKALLGLATGRVNIRFEKCPVLGCQYSSSRLDKHIVQGYPELSPSQLIVEQDVVRKSATIKELAKLRASNPLIPMMTGLDLQEQEEEDDNIREQENSEESDEPTCENRQCKDNQTRLRQARQSVQGGDRTSQVTQDQPAAG